MDNQKVTIAALAQKKASKSKITMVTAYDYPTARLVDEAGIDVILVGDSLAMVVLGYNSTVPVTLDEMLHHCKAVSRAVNRSFILGDMPFMSYQVSIEKSLENAGRLIKEGGCDAVKLEGGSEVVPTVEAIVKAGIPVCGHIGLTPQTATMLSGYKVQGKDADGARRLVKSAKDIENAGAFMVGLEAVPNLVAAKITEQLKVPVIGIGAGKDCDGQVLVFHDLVGLYDRVSPKFSKKYVDLSLIIKKALSNYKEEVQQGLFPGREHTFTMDPFEFERSFVDVLGRSLS